MQRDKDALMERLDLIDKRFDKFEALLRQALHPAMNLSVQEKDAAIRKALDTGDKAILKATLKQINGK